MILIYYTNDLKHSENYDSINHRKRIAILYKKEAFPTSLTYLVYITETMFICLRSQFLSSTLLILRPNKIDGDGVHEAEGGDNGQ